MYKFLLLVAAGVVSGLILWQITRDPQPPVTRIQPFTTSVQSLPSQQPPKSLSEPTWGGRWPWTSERLIEKVDLSRLSLADLDLMRNEIYARHGWVFDRWDLREYFARQTWYHPKGNFSNREQANQRVQAELTAIEKENARIIKFREQAIKR